MARTLNRLGNAKQVAAMKTEGIYADGGGLYLRVRGNGTRSWVIVRRTGGKRVERSLGTFESIGLADVREKARNYTDAPDAPAEKVIPTFGSFVDEFLPAFLPDFKNAKHRQQWENTLKTYCAPIWDKLVDAVSTEDVLGILRPIWQEKPDTASRLRGRMERVLGAAMAAGFRSQDSVNPAVWMGHLSHFLKSKAKKVKRHHPAMPFADVPAFMKELRARYSASARALELCILSACRTGEVIAARANEFDLAALVWTIPAARMKMEVEHQIPLTPRMAEIVEEMTLGISPTGLLFPGQVRTDRDPHLSNMAMAMLMRGMGADAYTVHGFRSAFRDWAGDMTDHPREIAEMALAHSVGSDVEASYRRSRALEKRRVLMQEWEDFLKTAPEAPRCVPEPEAHAAPVEAVIEPVASLAAPEAPSPVRKGRGRVRQDAPGQVSLLSDC